MTLTRGCLATMMATGVAGLLSLPVAAQGTAPPAAPTAFGANEPTPWYLGGSQGFVYDSNVYRVPDGPSDTYSSTSLFGGFDQKLGRQRVHGRGSVDVNRYFDQKQLDNTSYDLALGVNWETASSLSGDINAGLRRHLAYPAARSGVPDQNLNLGQTKWADARARWGGASILTVEGTLRHSRIDYSDESFDSSESSGNSGSLTLYYGGGGPLRLGIGGRYDRTETPKAGFDPIPAEFLSNTSTGRHIDFFADYNLTGQITTNLRLSYTDQSNSGVTAADFKGWTGRVAMLWQATGKLAVSASAARDSGFDSAFGSFTVVPPGSPPGTPPVTRLYENNRLTYSADLGAAYSATAKIDVTAGIHYTRANLVSAASDDLGVVAVKTTDRQRLVYIGVNYAFLRNASASCRLARELRGVSGDADYSLNSSSIGCHVRYIYR